MKLDGIIKNAPILNAPPSLHEKVMAAVREDRATRMDWTGRIPKLLSRPYVKPAMGAAAFAAVILLTVWAGLTAGPHGSPNADGRQAAAAEREFGLFLDQNLGTVYSFNSTENSAEYHVDEDALVFIEDNLNSIFYSNGGINA